MEEKNVYERLALLCEKYDIQGTLLEKIDWLVSGAEKMAIEMPVSKKGGRQSLKIAKETARRLWTMHVHVFPFSPWRGWNQAINELLYLCKGMPYGYGNNKRDNEGSTQ